MEHISPDSRPSNESGERPTLERRSLEYLWRWLVEQFGSKITSQFGESPPDSWGTTLYGLGADELRRGIDAVAESGSEWPPTAPEFRRLCRPADGRTWQQRVRDEQLAHAEALPQLEHLANRTAIGRRWFAFWVVKQLRPMPKGVTVDDLDDWLGDVDLDDMVSNVVAASPPDQRANVRAQLTGAR